MIYKLDKYIYPPRPENTFPRDGMNKFDNGVFMAQPKFDGSCCEIYINPIEWRVMNRHKSLLNGFKINKNEILSITPNKRSNVFVGEYMNKSKKDDMNLIFNDKFVIFDILVYNDEYLIGKTFIERYNILFENLNKIKENSYSYKITDNIYLSKNFHDNFGKIWDDLTKIDMIEGLVLKRKNAGLELGISQKNNTKSQLKCRKPTKNYNY